MEDNVKSFLDKIQELKDKRIKVNVNSKGTTVDCSTLTFKQQKDLISTIADGTIGSLKFQKYINDIIINNTGLSDLKITDRVSIILELRNDSIGNTVKINDIDVSIDDAIKQTKLVKYTQTASVSGDIDIELEIPTLTQENQIISATIESLKKDGDSDLGKNVGNIYTYEIIKYIKSVKFADQELLFVNVPVRDRVKIVENIPVSLNKEVVKFIQNNKAKEQDALTIIVNGEEKTIDIDVSFFDS